MFTDMVGYTALGQRSEPLSLALVEEQRKVIRPVLARHSGREVKTMGDAFLVEFPNAVDAVRCAYDIQRAVRDLNLSLETERRIHLRIGIHVGEVVEEQGDILGDAVNVASRIEPLAEDGGVCVSSRVSDLVDGKVDLTLTSIGLQALKNVAAPVEVFKMQLPWDEERTDRVPQLDVKRIAVLPFANFSPDPNDDYFADGITEEIISTISGIGGLSVISRTSVMGYKGTTKKMREIGKELEVGSILEGSVRKAGNRLRITTQLIEVANDRHLWAQNYDRNMDDVFEVQSEIAQKVAGAMKVSILTPELAQIEKRPTKSTTAYSLYLKGRFLWNKRGSEDLRQALDYFDQSVKEDPGFALGYAGKADCYLMLRVNYRIEEELNLGMTNRMLTKALELDPDLAEAHTARGMILNSEYGYEEAEKEFRRAIELKPSYATAHQWYFWMLRGVYRWKEAKAEIEKAFALDPLSPVIVGNYSDCLFALGETGEAIRQMELAYRLGVFNVFSLTLLGGFYLQLGRVADAEDVLKKGSETYPDDVEALDWLGHLELLKGNYARTKELWERAVEEGKKRSSDVRGFIADFALLYWTSGDRSRAMSCIEEIKKMPEDSTRALAFKRMDLALAYGAVNDAEGFFNTYSQLVEANQTEGGYALRLMPSLMPRSAEIYNDPRWGYLLKRVKLEPSAAEDSGP